MQENVYFIVPFRSVTTIQPFCFRYLWIVVGNSCNMRAIRGTCIIWNCFFVRLLSQTLSSYENLAWTPVRCSTHLFNPSFCETAILCEVLFVRILFGSILHLLNVAWFLGSERGERRKPGLLTRTVQPLYPPCQSQRFELEPSRTGSCIAMLREPWTTRFASSNAQNKQLKTWLRLNARVLSEEFPAFSRNMPRAEHRKEQSIEIYAKQPTRTMNGCMRRGHKSPYALINLREQFRTWKELTKGFLVSKRTDLRTCVFFCQGLF